MACRDEDGNLISADSTNMLNEHNLERISEEKVSQWSCHFLNVFNICRVKILNLFFFLDKNLYYLSLECRSQNLEIRLSWKKILTYVYLPVPIKWVKAGEMLLILMMSFLSMEQILFVYMKCSWDHWGRFDLEPYYLWHILWRLVLNQNNIMILFCPFLIYFFMVVWGGDTTSCDLVLIQDSYPTSIFSLIFPF